MREYLVEVGGGAWGGFETYDDAAAFMQALIDSGENPETMSIISWEDEL